MCWHENKFSLVPPRQNGNWRKVSSFLRSDNFNYGLLADAGKLHAVKFSHIIKHLND